MKRLMLIAVLAAPSVACVANQGDAPIRFLSAGALTGGDSGSCGIDGDKSRTMGMLDVSGGGGYLLGLRVETNHLEQQIIIGGETFSGGGLSDITLNELVLTYQSQPSIDGLPKEERIPYYGVFRPGTSAEGSYMLVYALGLQAREKLKGAVGIDQPVTVFSTIKARGVMSGGQKVETNEITFPITVGNSGYDPATNTCPGSQPNLSSVCGELGQDIGPICP